MWHNPSSIYVEAQRTAQAIDEARATVASWIGAQPEEIIFTSGGSESDNLALRGVLAASRARGQHLITNAAEHHAVLDTAEQLEREGAEVTLVDVGPDGRIDPAAVADAVREDTVLVSIMHANNEVGAMNDIDAISRAVHERNPRTVVHTDAVQSAAHMSVNVDRLGVDLLTPDGPQVLRPEGRGRALRALWHAARPADPRRRQESNRRAGTENTPGIVGLARAIEVAQERPRGRPLARTRASAAPHRGAAEAGADARHHRPQGPRPTVSPATSRPWSASSKASRSCSRSTSRAIAASSGSACTTGAVEPSHVLVAMGVPDELARGSLRFTLRPRQHRRRRGPPARGAARRIVERHARALAGAGDGAAAGLASRGWTNAA